MTNANPPPVEKQAYWTLLVDDPVAAGVALLDGAIVRLQEGAEVFSSQLNLVLVAGTDRLALVGTATAKWVVADADSPPKHGLYLENVEVLHHGTRGYELSSVKGPVMEAWLETKTGEHPCVLRRASQADFQGVRRIVAEARAQTEKAARPIHSKSDKRARNGLNFAADQVSPAVLEILATAAEYARRGSDTGVITSERLLDGLLRVGSEDLRRSSSANTGAAVVLLRLLNERNPAFVSQRELGETGGGSPPNNLEASPSTQTVFSQAENLARETGRERSRMSVRHLVSALLEYVVRVQGNTGAGKILIVAGYDLAELKTAFVSTLITAGPEDEREAWRRLFPPAPTADDPRAWLPSFNADLSSGEDRLGMRPDIEAMASLIVSRTLQPPLSIGLFGNWGSGKSFFMGKLRDEIRRLTRGDDAARGGAYWPNVVTVEFNAWHYVDANLWASLVSHLFGELQSWGKAEQTIKAEIKAQKDAELNKLKVASETRAAAEKRVTEAKQALKQAQKKHDDAVESVETNNRGLSVQLARDLWAEIAARPELGKDLNDAQTMLRECRLATGETLESVERLHGQLQQLGETGGRLRAIALSMLHGDKLGWGLVWLLAGTGVALWFALPGLRPFDFGPIASGVAQGAGVVIGAAHWITRSARRVSDLLAPLENVRRKVEAAYKTVRDQRDQRVAQLKQNVEVAMVEVNVATQALTGAEQELAAAQAAASEDPTARMISRFIEGRAASDDYRKHLGIVSTIRGDFDRLSGLITAHNEALQAAGADSPAPAATTDLGINRIVLFIDDLDRCPPARVVEVLQAIHLLLAFPLFVVVVGVDSRWVEHSLAMQYPELLKRGFAAPARGKSAAGIAEEPPARPSDYLEKIFQIPYRVSRIDATGCRNLIDALVVGDRGPAAPVTKTDAVPKNQEDRPPPDRSADGEPPTPKAKGDAAPGDASARPKVELKPPAAPPPARVLVEALRLTEPEIAAMKEFAPLIGRSPRATKRFVNIYRLLKAAVPPGKEQQAFVGGGFRVPMALLAVATKAPVLARQLALESAQDRHTGAALRTALEKLSPPPSGDEVGNPPESQMAATDAWKKASADDVAYWQRRVAQFSFEETLNERG